MWLTADCSIAAIICALLVSDIIEGGASCYLAFLAANRIPTLPHQPRTDQARRFP